MGMKDTEHPLSDVAGSEPMGKEQHSEVQGLIQK